MAKTVDELIVEIKAETRGLRAGLDQVNSKLATANKTARGSIVAFGGLGKVFAALGLASVGRSIVNTSRSFEDLEATLRAVTGSQANAAKGFDVVKEFTKTTPFQLANVTESFIKFYQAGIEPTGETLTAFGNLAAGMGKDITQLAQATFNATTGEMEMLKQFGIVARLEGDKVRMTFEGQTTVIDRTGESIGNFIRNLGAERFPTALAERLNTLSGSFSNLGDRASLFADEIGRAGLTGALRELSDLFQELIGSAGEGGLADALGTVLGGAVRLLTGLVNILDTVFRSIKNTIDDINQAIDNFDLKIAELTLSFRESFNESFFGELFELDEQEAIDRINKIRKKMLDRVGGPPTTTQPPTTGDEGEGTIDPKANQNTEELTGKVLQLKGAFDELKPALIESSQAFTGEFVDALMNGQNALESFRDFTKSLVSQIITTFLQLAVVNRILNSVFGLKGDDALTTLTLNRQGGGRVQRGSSYIVGESGPELFVPSTSGTVMNSMNTRGAVGGSNVVVNQSINFSTGVVPTVRAEVTKLLPQIADVTKGAVLESAMRGGNFRRSLQGG